MSHVGWDPDRGFDVSVESDPKLQEFFKKAGVGDRELQDKDTREFIYDFIDKHGGLEAALQEIDPAKSGQRKSSAPPPQSYPKTAPPPVPTAPQGTLFHLHNRLNRISNNNNYDSMKNSPKDNYGDF